ncbi:MAG: hypothetical protein ACT4OM_09900 [Actinomycetota bacterium]
MPASDSTGTGYARGSMNIVSGSVDFCVTAITAAMQGAAEDEPIRWPPILQIPTIGQG